MPRINVAPAQLYLNESPLEEIGVPLDYWIGPVITTPLAGNELVLIPLRFTVA